MHRVPRILACALAAGGLVAVSALTASQATAAGPLAPVSSYLANQLGSLTGQTPVLVHGATLAEAQQAVTDSGMSTVTSFDKIGVVVARGDKAQINDVREQPGVVYVEGNAPIKRYGTSGNVATRGDEAGATLSGANGQKLTGSGVSVGIIDSGVDPTHPAFSGGKVVANLKSLCLDESSAGTNCIVKVPNFVDTDTLSGGGHGSHVSGIAAGNPYTLPDGTKVGGAAPGAKVVSISTGAVLLIIGADAALNWMLENHAAPCGKGVSAKDCPPVKVINNSYGPTGGGAFDPNSATVKLQRALAKEGVVTVWAAGNDGGDGSQSLTNPPGQDPTGGVLSVASYNDQGTGTRSGTVSDYSSRGLKTKQSTWPDISAPGENIVSACRLYLPICSTGLKPQNGPGPLDIGTYNTISGTSMAAPHITGIVAQLFQANPNATPAQIEDALKSTALRYSNGAAYTAAGGYQSSFDKGTGLVDVVEAAKKLGAR